MYLVVNYDWNDNYGWFTKFAQARRRYDEVGDKTNLIEHWDKEWRKRIVWPKHKTKKTRYK